MTTQMDLFGVPAPPSKPARIQVGDQKAWAILNDEGKVIGASPHPFGTEDYEMDARTIRAFDAVVQRIVTESKQKPPRKDKAA